jgi:hypothetical protein
MAPGGGVLPDHFAGYPAPTQLRAGVQLGRIPWPPRGISGEEAQARPFGHNEGPSRPRPFGFTKTSYMRMLQIQGRISMCILRQGLATSSPNEKGQAPGRAKPGTYNPDGTGVNPFTSDRTSGGSQGPWEGRPPRPFRRLPRPHSAAYRQVCS